MRDKSSLPARFAVGALALVALAACAGTGSRGTPTAAAPRSGATLRGAPAPATTPSDAPAPSAAPAGTPAVVVPAPDATAPPTPFTGPAADRFGADDVMVAYRFATAYMLRSTFDGTLISLRQPRQSDFAAVEAGLTPAALGSFRRLSATLESTTENLTPQQTADLVALTTYGVTASFPGHTLRAPSYRNAGFGAAAADVFRADGRQDALVLRFPVTGTYLMNDAAGKPVALDYKKDMDLSLLQTGDPAQPWLIDGWRGTRTLDGPKPDA